MRILSLNVWGGRLHEPLMHYLATADADVLCLQEVTHTPASAAEWLTYRDGDASLLQRANLFAEIGAALPDHQAFFAPTARGTLFDGEHGVQSEFGLATFMRRSLPVIAQVTGFVHGSFSPDGFGPHPRARNAQCLRVHDYAGGHAVTICQMHGLRDPAGKGDTPERDAQAAALIRMINGIRQQDDERLVVCGDFNVLPESRMFAALAGIGLSDLVTTRGHTDTRTSHYTKSGRFADYMLVTDKVGVRRFDVVAQPEVSDHRALVLNMD